ncbi:putative GNAT family acetyltransferase [Lojkania enalia]|uniref:GNAT family acetyltransferase n=1 Tax=Lojkania enalia TaxID=147567 RepID=A0A9P4JYQ6_9PLEO|nr:putative GNAT family acetyltransferase [Didymosphaeria enalia]
MSSQPRFVTSEVDLDRDWDELMRAFWTSWKTPLQASGELTFPHLGTNTPEEEAAFNSMKKMLLNEAKNNPGSVRWLKCTDTKSARIAGAACFKHEKEWPRPGANFTGCGFDPGSELQELSDSFYRQLLGWRLRIMKGEHIYGQSIFVLPDYRNAGVANQILEYCADVADKLGLECFVEGTVFSTPVLMLQGFIVIGWTNMIFTRRNPSRDWERLVHDIQSHPIGILWRPKMGKYVEGETVLPWTGKVREAKL